MIVDKYEIRFFPVGNSSKGGDAILLRLYDTEGDLCVIVIDGGYTDDGQAILDYLTQLGIGRIDLVVNTHPDEDHILGLITIFSDENIEIGELLMNRPWLDANLKVSYFKDGRITENSLNNRITDKFKKAYELEQLAIKKIGEENIIHPERGMIYRDMLFILGPSSELYNRHLLASDKTPVVEGMNSRKFSLRKLNFVRYIKGTFVKWIFGEQTSDINETSLVMYLDLNDHKFLFTGDAGQDGLKEALDFYETHNGCKASDFTHMQLPHHGSRKNMNPTLIQRIGSHDYFISCPPNGFDEGHPSKRLINKILSIYPSAKVYSTQGNWLSHYRGLNLGCQPASYYRVFDEIDE